MSDGDLGLGAWFRDTPESRQMLSEEELKLDRDEWKARAEAAEAVIEQVRASHRRQVSDEGFGATDEWCYECGEDWPCATVRLLPEVTP